MEAVSQYSGFLAAHSIHRVFQGEDIVPILAYEKADGSHDILKLPEPLHVGLSQASEWLRENPEKASHAVVVFQGSVVIDDKDVDAIICQSVQFEPDLIRFKIATPFKRAKDPSQFKVYRIKIMDYQGPENPDFDAIVAAFFSGIENNEQGADVWYDHLDQSK